MIETFRIFYYRLTLFFDNIVFFEILINQAKGEGMLTKLSSLILLLPVFMMTTGYSSNVSKKLNVVQNSSAKNVLKFENATITTTINKITEQKVISSGDNGSASIITWKAGQPPLSAAQSFVTASNSATYCCKSLLPKRWWPCYVGKSCHVWNVPNSGFRVGPGLLHASSAVILIRIRAMQD